MDGSQSHQLSLLQRAAAREGAGRQLWGPTVRGTFCFPTDGRDLGTYHLPCTEVPTGYSEIVTPRF